MKRYVDYYKLEKISSRMAKEFGTIPKGDEEMYSFMLHPMEGNLIKLRRKNHLLNGRHAIEAIHMCLLKIDGYINGIEYDFSGFETYENKVFLEGLLASFDPFTNNDIFDMANKTYNLDTSSGLREFFENPVKCLLRIEKSIKLWTEQYGANGYFEFIESQIGDLVKKDEKMDYAILLKNCKDFQKPGIEIPFLKENCIENGES